MKNTSLIINRTHKTKSNKITSLKKINFIDLVLCTGEAQTFLWNWIRIMFFLFYILADIQS